MEWSNDRVFEFIQLLQGEPDIWDPKRKGYTNRNNINDAWIRISRNFSIPCTIEEMKRKRNTLMTQYRECLKKIKDSMKSGSSADDIYKPSWFAFDALHTFMGAVYENYVTISTEERTEETPQSQTDSVETSSPRPQSRETASIETSPRPNSRESNSRSGSDAFASKRQRGAQNLLIARKQMDEAFSLIKEHEEEVNACDLYGQLLAEKLKLLDIDDRLVIMNEIDNLVFKQTMNVRQRNSLPTTQIQQVLHRQPTYLPRSSNPLIPRPVASQSNIQNSQSILNYEMPLRTSTPVQDTNAQNNCAIQINIPEVQLSPDTANYALHTSRHNNLYDYNIPSTSKNQYKKSEVGDDDD